MHEIKKYANRKLYDTTDKRYVSMDQLADLIKAGEEVSIIDNRTGEDLTSSVVSQLLGRDNRGRSKTVPSGVLFQLLRRGGGTFSDYAKRYAALWQSAFTMAEDEIDKLVNRLVSNKELTKSEARRLKQEVIGQTESVKRWVGERIDRRINEAMAVMNLATRDQVVELTQRVDRLGRELKALRDRLPHATEKTKRKPAAPKAKAREKRAPAGGKQSGRG
jgi:polyhydroxyalkanoate synthesis repressor PhaR